MTLRFHKMHGLGNDFVVIDARPGAIEITPGRARALADRHTGIGCDQIILVGPGDAEADVTMRIWNADGSEVAACGNVTRCIPVLLGRDVTVRTAAGLLHARLDGDGAAVDMGVARFEWEAIPLAYPMDTLKLPMAWGMLEHPVAVNVGNPHLVFFVGDAATAPLAELGPAIEVDPVFPERTNVNVAHILAPDRIEMRTWERGAGLTRACGTGACAVFASARRLGRIAAEARITLPGGVLDLSEVDGRLMMRGPATHVFGGETEL